MALVAGDCAWRLAEVKAVRYSRESLFAVVEDLAVPVLRHQRHADPPANARRGGSRREWGRSIVPDNTVLQTASIVAR
jgi:hypothetical protein